MLVEEVGEAAGLLLRYYPEVELKLIEQPGGAILLCVHVRPEYASIVTIGQLRKLRALVLEQLRGTYYCQENYQLDGWGFSVLLARGSPAIGKCSSGGG